MTSAYHPWPSELNAQSRVFTPLVLPGLWACPPGHSWLIPRLSGSPLRPVRPVAERELLKQRVRLDLAALHPEIILCVYPQSFGNIKHGFACRNSLLSQAITFRDPRCELVRDFTGSTASGAIDKFPRSAVARSVVEVAVVLFFAFTIRTNHFHYFVSVPYVFLE